MNSKITISLFRVSADSKYLDMIFDCPENYYFISLVLEVKSFTGKEFITKMFDLTNALFNENTVEKKHWIVRIPLENLYSGIIYPAIYKETIKIAPTEGNTADCQCANDESCLEDHMICSDVNQAYKCMLDDLLDLREPCFEISDELIRKYLLLYGHQSALQAGDYEVAEDFFKFIVNCFKACPPGPNCGICATDSNKKSTNNCNCRRND